MLDPETLFDSPSSDPRFRLYSHLYDVHGWTGRDSYNYASKAEPGSQCPECGCTDYQVAA